MSSLQEPLQRTSSLLLDLPREIRDTIYAFVFEDPTPSILDEGRLHKITNPAHSNAIVASEALEAHYIHVPQVIFIHPNEMLPSSPFPSWTTHSFIPSIRHLVVSAEETGSRFFSDIDAFNMYEIAHAKSCSRRLWETLLKFERLSTLEIRMQKRTPASLFTHDFGPVVYALREFHPGLKIAFSVSFDDFLEYIWVEPHWSEEQVRFKRAGFTDASELLDPPSDEDRAYVAKYLPDHLRLQTMPNGRNIEEGLLDLNVKDRRALAKHYIVQEPQLLRMLLAEQWRVYQKMNRKTGEGSAKA
ncbi:hypothetical protein EJ04DRAFT_511289 [Polyplosphaeria fusca]|uniref:Uncharacterized protein n=1 Tax=Polyplosphaeria fusca TaxID=682080 RepID=A0A9P4R3D5_9PLEO|nr:hypothetical protein EJ04DRAFT_511289 [Polyplosphaeria fusca]